MKIWVRLPTHQGAKWVKSPFQAHFDTPWIWCSHEKVGVFSILSWRTHLKFFRSVQNFYLSHQGSSHGHPEVARVVTTRGPSGGHSSAPRWARKKIRPDLESLRPGEHTGIIKSYNISIFRGVNFAKSTPWISRYLDFWGMERVLLVPRIPNLSLLFF